MGSDGPDYLGALSNVVGAKIVRDEIETQLTALNARLDEATKASREASKRAETLNDTMLRLTRWGVGLTVAATALALIEAYGVLRDVIPPLP